METLYMFFSIAGPGIFYGLLIFLIVFLVKRSKKKKLVKEFSQFKGAIVETIQSYGSPSQKHFFEEMYDNFMEDVDRGAASRAMREIPELKERYRASVRKLVSISDNNTVFFTSSEEEEAFERRVSNSDLLQRNDVITQDIIRTLPDLAEFVDIHNRLVANLYIDILEDVDRTYDYLWRGLTYTNYNAIEDEKVRLHFQEVFEASYGFAKKVYDSIIQSGWETIIADCPQYNTPECQKDYMKLSDDMALFHKWATIWTEQFEAVAQKDNYDAAKKDLSAFFMAIHKEYSDYEFIKYASAGFVLDDYSSFPIGNIRAYDSNEIMRIHSLYVSGKMRGRYYKEDDPKYRNN